MRHTGTVRLETERLVLRPFAMEDAPVMNRSWCNDEDVIRFLGWPVHGDVSNTEALLRQWTASNADPEVYNWGICEKDTGLLFGSIGVVNIDAETETCEIGYCIAKDHWRKGYTPEAAGAVIDHLLRTCGAKAVCAKHDINNPASGAVMRKCGMKYRETREKAFVNNTGVCDVAIYAVTAEERYGAE